MDDKAKLRRFAIEKALEMQMVRGLADLDILIRDAERILKFCEDE